MVCHSYHYILPIEWNLVWGTWAERDIQHVAGYIYPVNFINNHLHMLDVQLILSVVSPVSASHISLLLYMTKDTEYPCTWANIKCVSVTRCKSVLWWRGDNNEVCHYRSCVIASYDFTWLKNETLCLTLRNLRKKWCGVCQSGQNTEASSQKMSFKLFCCITEHVY